jgi:uncharacterized membrane protein
MALGLLLVVCAVSGVAVDMTRLFLARRSLQSVADAASLHGAAMLDREALYRSSGTRVRILPTAARRAALRTIELRALPAEAVVSVRDDRVTVALRATISTTLLGMIGIETLPVAVVSTSAPVEGVP